MKLPQYSAQAVASLEQWARTHAKISADNKAIGYEDHGHHRNVSLIYTNLAQLIRGAVHVVLPANGEIYKDNSVVPGQAFPLPTADEIESFTGLPGPVTCFEFDWQAMKMVALVCDGKQFENPFPQVTAMAIVKNAMTKQRFLPITDYMRLVAPLEVIPGEGFLAAAENIFQGMERNPEYPEDVWQGIVNPEIAHEVQVGLGAAIQCCHALRAGASLKECTPRPADSLRCAQLASDGVRGFSYHVLKLPGQVHEREDHGGSHASPRLHVRRAHIRKLSTGALTFVRRCFVGRHEFGFVSKSYSVGSRVTA